MICIGGDLHRRPPMHALYALSQDAPAGRGCAEEMCYRRRTRHQDGGRRVPTRGKKRLTTQGEKDGEDDLRRPQSTAKGGASGGADAEIESRRLATCPRGWHQEEPGGTRGYGPHPPLAMGHGVLLLGHGLLGHVEPFPRQMSSGWGSLWRALADVPGRGSLGGDPEGGVPRVRRQTC